MAPIHERIRDDLLAMERRLWTALTSADPGPEIKKMSNDDANFLFPKRDILTLQSKDPSLSEALKPPFHHFEEYELKDVRVLIIDLMAGTVTYKINARLRGKIHFNGTGSTTWSQGSDGEWRIVVHQETSLE
ncbi:nuclear transport factor 2 family protein [Aspergillus aculeatinus CBS 121060]|uniref:DUF4440 domain-containing protein n=8 Tax=Aspergillus TaxID=5052 RepID=A0A319D607_9EURO|nr:uncharacterized protein ASPACDRAFT_81091 [Aspergillus aculeatus ATCC 16872]XP_025436614.1 hypothetical protein BO95DRAFT_376478 [Aspergillus brunneoviolaceus CBS 621.78]XP_025496613.1 hypothetical protein BO82DRAFT_397588 [Aspergillus uvarum CBS 121591]XP_025503044.1 hypothetical protein BO66DRAFT_429336 [Aspergillus aculeatinus CBS 121060]XP_025524665.1 hypothetical protein BO86DRAFT_174125 [Aspergillus japonicus CBS 114.51]XP_040799427.1 uncharacterized protein BO72DRAFT_449806 [Aspergill